MNIVKECKVYMIYFIDGTKEKINDNRVKLIIEIVIMIL